MKFCTNCGAQVLDGSKFCTECGQRIEAEAPAVQVPKSEAPAAVHVYGQPVNHGFSEPVVPEAEQGVVHTYGAPVSHNFTPPVQAEFALSGTYGTAAAAPVQPEPVAVPAPAYETTPAPAQPAAEAGSYAPPVVVEEKKAKTARQKKQKSGKKKSRLGLIIAVVIAIVVGLFSCTGGGNSDDPNLGVYNGISCSYAGFEMGADGEWIELKSGGKLKMNLMGEEYSGKWELDGEDLTVTQAGDTYYGTLSDGVLVLDLAGVIYTYEKEAAAVPDTTKESEAPEETAAPTPAASEIGYWTLKYSEGNEDMAMDEDTVAMLAEMGVVMYVDLKEDGTGTFTLDDVMPITWGDGKLVADDGSEIFYTLENGELIVDMEGARMHFVPGEKSSETEITDTENDTEQENADLLNGERTDYIAISGRMNGTEMNDSAIAQMGGMELDFNGDGTGTLGMFGQYEEITYDNSSVYRSGIPMSYELDGDYLYLKVSDAIEFTMMVEIKAMNRPKEDLTQNDLDYWEGDYYGWWCIDNVIEGDDSAEGNWWDCCMTLDIFSNGAGFITIWDEDYGKDDPIAQVEVSVSITDGVARIVSESGQFMDTEVEHADWLFYSDSTDYKDTLGFFAPYEDSTMKLDCYFFLRQWGTLWDDVDADDPNNMPYYYEDWYLPLIEDGEVVAPRTIGK